MTTLFDVLRDALANLKVDRHIFCGMTANVDIVLNFKGDAFLRAQERFGSDPADTEAPPSPNLATTAQALDYSAWFMAHDTGGEAEIPSIAPLSPLIEAMPNFRVVGGTGIQAANWLAGAGFTNTVVYIPRLAPEFDGLIHPGLKAIDNNAGYADLIAENPEFSEIHCIIDYAKGAKLRYGGAARETVRDDRVILSGDRCNARLRISQEFHDAACRAFGDSSLLVTGFNSSRELADNRIFIEQCVSLMKEYRAANPGGFIHVEDCFQWDSPRERRTEVAGHTWPLADSVGMNEVEYRELCALFSLSGEDVFGALREMAARHGLKRICLHTASECRVVTRYPRRDELRAIGLAVLFSGSRAYYGVFVEKERVAALIEATRTISEAAAVPEAVAVGGGYYGQTVPTLKGIPVRSSIGLGDAFTAGLMAYL